MKQMRLLIWAYLWLLIFEGAIRKWIAPGLDAPLLVIRDPVVLWIYYEAMRHRLSFNNAFFWPNLVLCILAFIFSCLGGFDNILVTIYGVTVDFFQIPLIFVMPQILNRKDVIAIGKFFLILSIPMCLLVVCQFRSSPDSLLNKGAFHTWYGTVRPSGTFSFIAGLVAYYCVTAGFLFYGYVQRGIYPIWLIALVTCDVLLTAAVSGSRTCLISIGIVTIVAVICVLLRGKGGVGMLVAAVLIGLAVPVLSQLSVVQDGTDQLTRRFKDAAAANEDASGMANRYAETMLEPLYVVGQTDATFGRGLGLGTNAASFLVRGRTEFLGSEDEWGRLVFESGPIIGLLLIVFRVALTLAIGFCAYRALRRDNFLPMLLFAGSAISILNGQWGVPTSLGFAIVGAGLVLAACNEPEDDEYSDEENGEEHLDDHDHDRDHGREEDESNHAPTRDKVA